MTARDPATLDRMCRDKVRMERVWARHIARERGMRAYRCPHCLGWHITSKPRRQRVEQTNDRPVGVIDPTNQTTRRVVAAVAVAGCDVEIARDELGWGAYRGVERAAGFRDSSVHEGVTRGLLEWREPDRVAVPTRALLDAMPDLQRAICASDPEPVAAPGARDLLDGSRSADRRLVQAILVAARHGLERDGERWRPARWDDHGGGDVPDKTIAEGIRRGLLRLDGDRVKAAPEARIAAREVERRLRDREVALSVPIGGES